MPVALSRWFRRPPTRRPIRTRLGYELLEDRAVPSISGAIFTSSVNGGAVNQNLYDVKSDVYLNGGPQHTASKGLTNGRYYFQVTTPAGVLLSTDDAVLRQIQVVGNVVAGAYDPDGIGPLVPHANGTFNPANGSTPVQLIPFDDTTNNGGEYKVWLIAQTAYTTVSGAVITFRNSDSKTDNFKVGPQVAPTVDVTLTGRKFDDLNGNGDDESGDDPGIVSWPITITLGNGTSVNLSTAVDGTYSYTTTVKSSDLPLSYTVAEGNKSGWTQTFPGSPNDYTGSLTFGSPSVEHLDFGNFHNVALSGIKFEDVNGNGVRDTGDKGLAGWAINVGNQTATTAADGTWSVTVGPGKYAIQEAATGQPWTSFTQTYGTAGYSVIAVSGVDVGGNDFGNFHNVALSGIKFEDVNGNGVKDPGDTTGLVGWHILVDGVDKATTAADGTWSVTDVGPGPHTVLEVNQSGWTQTYAIAGYSVTAVSGQNVGLLDFGNFHNVTLRGVKFYDANMDRVKNNLEPNVSAWPVTLTVANGPFAGTYTVVTNASGQYAFGDLDNADGDNNPLTGSDLGPGVVYTVAEGSQAGWVATTATSATGTVGTTVTSGAAAVTDFGNVKLGATGGKTLGFWSNKNGEDAMKVMPADAFGVGMAGALGYLNSLGLVNAAGTVQTFATYTQFRSWLLNATATNMAYMLSAQLAATALDVRGGLVGGTSLIYAPSLTPFGVANAAGFVTVNTLIAAAKADLATTGHKLVLSDSPFRAKQEAMKIVLDGINNNLSISVVGLSAWHDYNSNGVIDPGEI